MQHSGQVQLIYCSRQAAAQRSVRIRQRQAATEQQLMCTADRRTCTAPSAPSQWLETRVLQGLKLVFELEAHDLDVVLDVQQVLLVLL